MTEATTNESSGKNRPRPLSTWLLRLAIFSALASVGAALSLAGCGGSDEDVPVLTDDAATEGDDLLPGYDDVLQRALDKDPHRRWRSVEAFRRALERVRVGEEIPTRILIADDDEDWRTLLHDALQPRFPDAVIDLVSDGEQAIAAFEKNPYSVVLVDLQMPEVDGMRLTAHLRSLDASDQTPIIVMTAAGGPGEWKRLSQIGADAFLVKPVAFEDVAMQITRTMKSRHRKT